jgi:hypothetical protein
MPTQPDPSCYPLVEMNQQPPSTTRAIERREGTHTGCGVCRILIKYDYDDDEMSIILAVPAGVLALAGLEATVVVTSDASETRRYAAGEDAVLALERGQRVRWTLPRDVPTPAALVICFVYPVDDATLVSHDRVVSLDESAHLAPAAE